jgi:pimeloyl-ACP methyl ester carboxylesterase
MSGDERLTLGTVDVDVDAASPAWFRAAIGSPVDEGTVVVHGCRIRYRRWGTNPSSGVALVHGGAAHSHWWDHIAPLLAEERSVVALDLSGHGRSDRRGEYSLDLWADEVVSVLDSVALDRPTVIGHSLGGFVALRAAKLFGSRLAGVAAVDSPLRDFTPEERAARERRAFGPLRVYPTREAVLARFRPVPADGDPLPYVADYIAERSITPVDGGWSWRFDPGIFGRAPLDPTSLHAPACRVAVFRAEDGLLTAQMSAAMTQRVGRPITVVDLPATGHHVMLDQPLALVAALRTLLACWSQDPAG